VTRRAARAAAALAACVALAAARPARAQSPPAPDPWVYRVWLYPTYDGLEGFGGALSTGWRRAARPGPISSTAAIELDGAVTAAGTRTGQIVFDYPGLWPHWRFLALAGADRLERAPYFGLGNEPVGDTADAVRYFRYSLLRTTFLSSVERDLGHHLRAQVGTQVRHYHAQPLGGDTTLLLRDLAAGAVDDTGRTTGVELRTGLLFDTRDEEFSPSRGVLVEALMGRGVGSLAYTRYRFEADEFAPLGEMTVLGLRQSVELADRDIPFYVMYERLTDWRPEDGFGGPTTLRATLPGRFLAPNRAIVSVDLRYKKIDFPLPTSPFRVWLVAFGDVGRLWMNGEQPDLTGLHWDGGVGGFLQISKGSMFGLDVGVSGTDGFQFGSAFTFAF